MINSGFFDTVAGANRNAGGFVIETDAVNTFGRIDNIRIVPGRYGLYGAFGLAGAAHDAAVVDFVCHENSSRIG